MDVVLVEDVTIPRLGSPRDSDSINGVRHFTPSRCRRGQGARSRPGTDSRSSRRGAGSRRGKAVQVDFRLTDPF